MRRLSLLFIAAMFLIAACTSGNTNKEPVYCPADVFECPDGTFVSRDANNNCEFKACPPQKDTNDIIETTCQQDSDCMLIFGSLDIHCCQNSCPIEPVSRNQGNQINQQRDGACKLTKIACPEVMPPSKEYCETNFMAKCVENKCVLKKSEEIMKLDEYAQKLDECTQKNGVWGGSFPNGPKECLNRLTDGEKPCTDSSQCQGICIAIRDNNNAFLSQGRCSDVDLPSYYCWSLEKGRPTYYEECKL